MSFEDEFTRQAAQAAEAQGQLTAEQAQEMIFGEGPKPFRYTAEVLTNPPLPPMTRWVFQVPNGSVIGWLRKEDLMGIRKVVDELIEEMEKPEHKLSVPTSGLYVPGQP